MLDILIANAYKNLATLDCCHEDKDSCCCYDCLKKDFRERPDEYDCEKKMNYYVAKYGASYASEFYNYLEKSQVLEGFNNSTIKIASLGCGFSPDYYAIAKYITDKKLKIKVVYNGKDNSPFWNNVRLPIPSTSYELFDLCNPFSIVDYDIVIMSKVFSTLYKHKKHMNFIANLQNAVSAVENSVIVFNDINSYYMGRDCFDSRMSRYFNDIHRFYTDTPPHKEDSWIKLDDLMVFPIIPNETIDPINEIRQYVFFEYRK